MVDTDERVSETLRREFSEEAFAKLDMPEEKKKKIIKRIDNLFQHGREVGVNSFSRFVSLLTVQIF